MLFFILLKIDLDKSH